MDLKNTQIVLSVGAFILVSLLSGNLFFVARLIDKLDSLELRYWEQRQEIVRMSGAIETITKQIGEDYERRKVRH
jgi:hypothetical protein